MRHTHFYINIWGVCFDDRAFGIFRNGWISGRDAFSTVSCCSLFILLRNGLKMSEF